jgi:tRNA pseudouridine38-40 synthase
VQYRTYEYILPTFVFAPIVLGSKKFTFDDAALERVNSLLKVYEGTHKFHNFTVGTSYSDPAAHRYMISVTVSNGWSESRSD